MKPWARYDRDFVDDEEHVLAMPAAHRAAAYALLLAINGKCYRRPATGRLHCSDVEALAAKLAQKSRTLLPILEAVGLVENSGEWVILPRFFEWNPELKPEFIEQRSEAGKAGAEARWHGKPHAAPHSTSHSKSHAISHGKSHGTPNGKSHATPHAVPDAIPMPDIRDREIDVSTRSNALTPIAPLPPKAAEDSMEAAFLVAVHEGLGRTLTFREEVKLVGWWRDMPHLRPDLAAARIKDYLSWRGDHLEPKDAPLTNITLLHDQLRDLDARLADAGMTPRHAANGRVKTGLALSAVKDVLAAAAQDTHRHSEPPATHQGPTRPTGGVK